MPFLHHSPKNGAKETGLLQQTAATSGDLAAIIGDTPDTPLLSLANQKLLQEHQQLAALCIKLLEMLDIPPGTLHIDLVNKKLERLIRETSFRKKHLQEFKQLTPREIEVLGLLASGCANKEVATKLTLSVETVKYYHKIIKSKLEAASTSELVHYAQAFDLI